MVAIMPEEELKKLVAAGDEEQGVTLWTSLDPFNIIMHHNYAPA